MSPIPRSSHPQGRRRGRRRRSVLLGARTPPARPPRARAAPPGDPSAETAGWRRAAWARRPAAPSASPGPGQAHRGTSVRADHRCRPGRSGADLADRVLAGRHAEVDRARRRAGSRRRKTLALAPGAPAAAANKSPSTARRHHRRQHRRRRDRASARAAQPHQVHRPGRHRDRQGRSARHAAPGRDRGRGPGKPKCDRFESAHPRRRSSRSGPVRAVVRIDGKHRSGNRDWLPFSVRLYFYAGGDSFRMVHTFIFDGTSEPGRPATSSAVSASASPSRCATTPTTGTSASAARTPACWREAVRASPGLRRDPGAAVAGRAGRRAEAARPGHLDQRVTTRLHLHPGPGATTPCPALAPTASRSASAPRPATAGSRRAAARRAAGFGYVGGASGGLAFGLRDFWQSYPAQLDIRDAHTDAAEVTLWLWSPEAAPMDLRFYHDGMGQDTYAEQLEGLEHHLRGLRARLRHPVRHRPHQRTLLLGADAATPSAERPRPAGRRRPHAAAARRAARASCTRPKVFGGLCSRPTAPPRPRRRSRTSSTSSSRTTRTRSSSAAGTASGTTATSCTPTTPTATCGATTSAASPGTTPSSRPTCGSGTPSCAPAAPTSSASPRR